MSPKKTILKALKAAPELRPPTIPGYVEQPARYQEAVNALLRDRLVEGRKDAEGHMTIALNEHRRGDVERLLRPLWARPALWAALGALVVAGAALLVA
jgi:hypothetical protein